MYFLKGHFFSTLKLATPLVIGSTLPSIALFLNMIWFAKLGTTSLAAGALVVWVFLTFLILVIGILSAINILIAYRKGANDYRGIAGIFQSGIILATLLALLSAVLFWNLPKLLLLMGQPPHLVLVAKGFLHILSWGFLPQFLQITFIEIFLGLGLTMLVLVSTFINISLGLIFSYVIIFGKFGIPSLGIEGMGWGIVITNWISTFFLCLYFFSQKQFEDYSKNLFSKIDPAYLLEIMSIGLPIGIMCFVEFGFFFVFTVLMGQLGINKISANQIVLQYVTTLNSIVFVISQAATIRMSYFLGSRDVISAKHASYTGMILSMIWIILAIIFCYKFPMLLIALFFDIDNPANLKVIHYATQFLPFAALFLFFETIRTSIYGALRGFKDTVFILFTSVLCFWIIALPLGYYLDRYTALEGGIGLWLGMILGALGTLPLLYWRFEFKFRQFKEI